VTVGVELLAGGVERLDVVLEEGRDKAALGKLNTVVELDQSLLWCLGILDGGGLGRGVSKGTLRDGLEGKGKNIYCLEEVGGEAGDGKVLGLFLLTSSIALEVKEVGLKVSQPALKTIVSEMHISCRQVEGTNSQVHDLSLLGSKLLLNFTLRGSRGLSLGRLVLRWRRVVASRGQHARA
jgi:hypothetical protein